MVGRDGAEARKERLQRIARTVQAALHKENKMPLARTVAVLQYDMGLTREKIMEYLGILADLEQFTLDFENDEIKKTDEKGLGDKVDGGIT
jgi:hypothetical protein